MDTIERYSRIYVIISMLGRDLSHSFFCRIHALLALGESCKTRLYFLKSQLDSYDHGKRDERPNCLINPELNKIRLKLLKNFPVIPDVSKSTGYELIQSHADEITTKLLTFRTLVDDIVTFVEESKDLLNMIVTSILDFHVSSHLYLHLKVDLC
jgi:hypothetical protein